MEEPKLDEIQINNFVCPFCHHELIIHNENISCSNCNKHYTIIDGVLSFNQKDEYWCNVSREKMRQLNTIAKNSGDWLSAAKELIPEYMAHFEPFDRGDAQYLWPVSSDARILDAGSMWGGVTLPIAQHCGEIFAVDKTVETLAFLKIRAQQMGFQNVYTVASTLQKLPFPDDFFDLVILNGVLEWVAFDQPVILENHWGQKRTDDSPSYQKKPREMQVDVLLELNRILKPGGHIYVAIENSIGYQYLAGFPDDHVNLKYVSFLPRFLANAITKRKLNCDYRTYTYSLPGYRSLLKDGGYSDLEFYGAFPHYIAPSEIIPIDLIKDWKAKVLPLESPLAPTYAKFAARLFPKSLLKHVSPSFLIIGRKGQHSDNDGPRILQILQKIRLIETSSFSNIDVIKVAGREGNHHTVNFLISNKSDLKPKYFCKISRNESFAEILENEATNLETINDMLTGTDIDSSIPQLLHFGKIDGITIAVMEYIDAGNAKFDRYSDFSENDLEDLDQDITPAIAFLAKFQKYTTTRKVDAKEFLSSIIGKQKDILEKDGKLTEETISAISKLDQQIRSLNNITIPICAVHGDYDFYYNILFNNDDVKVVDLEHFETEGMPFLDLATLIFNPILMNNIFSDSELDIAQFIAKCNLNSYMNKWLHSYAELSGINIDVVKMFAKIAALEQQTKEYPYYRNPSTFPMYNQRVFHELLSFDIDI